MHDVDDLQGKDADDVALDQVLLEYVLKHFKIGVTTFVYYGELHLN